MTDKLERELRKAERRVKALSHAKSMQDPTYRAFYEKFGDPETIGRTHARMILRARKDAEEG